MQLTSQRTVKLGKGEHKHAEDKTKWLAIPFAICLCVPVGQLCAQESAGPALHIDIPIRLEKANVVIDMGHLVFGGDNPFALADINLLASELRDWNSNGQIVVIFHGDATYLVLNDET
jgi:hypothetical protein